MKDLFMHVILITAYLRTSFCCEENFKLCKSDSDCCSKNCYNSTTLNSGICKPKAEDCEWLECGKNGECCSGICEETKGYKLGICVEEKPTKPVRCISTWLDCVSNKDCCSGLCEKSGDKKFGVCVKELRRNPEKVRCVSNWLECVQNQECCSGLCEKPRGHKFGLCVTAPRKKIERCVSNWLECVQNQECCSGLCDKPDGREIGICVRDLSKKPKKARCIPHWLECLENQECCSGTCEKPNNNSVGLCVKDQCSPLSSEKLRITCSTSDDRLKPCDKPLPNHSKAVFSCNPSGFMKFKEPPYKQIHCKNGLWNSSLIDNFCRTECGQLASLPQPFVKYGKQVEFGGFPWHAGIYEYDPKIDQYDSICGATLISHTAAISVAHCFDRGMNKKNRQIQLKNLSTLKVAVGKRYRNFTLHEDEFAQIVDIKTIDIHPQFRGLISRYAYDIAVVTFMSKVEYSGAVGPACIFPFEEDPLQEYLEKGDMGKVAGFGATEEDRPSETLMMAEMAFIPKDDCINEIDITLLDYVTGDKICAGDKNSSETVCRGDSGGGLVFENPKTKTYDLRGIVSVGKAGCAKLESVLFTDVTYHKPFLQKFLVP